jgi:hypothetical protein
MATERASKVRHCTWLLVAIVACSSLSAKRTAPTASACLPPSADASEMLDTYQWTDTTSDEENIEWREGLALPRIPVGEISLVHDEVICRRALLAFNQLFAHEKTFRAVEAVNVIRYGSTRFIVEHPNGPMGGEWRSEPVFDSSFRKVAIAGR